MRYAIYYTPGADHPISRAAATWFGRDVFTGAQSSVDHDFSDLIGSPRRYGFHGTLKAPFRLAETTGERTLIEAFDAFLEMPRAVPQMRFKVGSLGDFLALVPADGALDELAALAGDCLRAFEPFRAPLSRAEIDRRRPASLSDRQRGYLERFGYPYVLDDFRFHMTLTNAIEDRALHETVKGHLMTRFSDLLREPVRMDSLAIFHEPAQGADFRVLRLGQLKPFDSDELRTETA